MGQGRQDQKNNPARGRSAARSARVGRARSEPAKTDLFAAHRSGRLTLRPKDNFTLSFQRSVERMNVKRE